MHMLLGTSERIKRILALAVFALTILSLLSLPEQASSTSRLSLSIPILMYHHVGDWGESRAEWAQWVVRSKEFRSQMDWLVANGFHTITFRELLEAEATAESLPAKSVIISFDDGWSAQEGVVRAELEPRGMHAVFFVYTAAVGATPNNSGYISWQQLRILESAGHEVQSHTVSHGRLTDMPPSQLDREMRESRATIEREMQHPVQVVAYPFGICDERVMRAASAAGYVIGLRADADLVLGKPLQYRMPRIRVGYDDGIEVFAEAMMLSQSQINAQKPKQ
jgi:peptidoglycan/xylan/chitin deacetylase (PgdA/CDA1 family)